MLPAELSASIYEASVVPELWPRVLGEINELAGPGGCTLITVDGDRPHWISSPNIEPMVADYFSSGWADKNDRVERSMRERHFGCVRDIDIYSREEIEALPFVREFLQPLGFGWGAAILNPLPNGEFVMFSLERLWDAGPVPDSTVRLLHDIQPYLMRGALLSMKLRYERARAAVDSFGLAEIPAAVVRANGKVIAANDLFAGLGPQLRIGADDALRVHAAGASELLDAALGRLRASDGSPVPHSIAVPGTDEDRPLVLHVLPAEGVARDILGSDAALLLITRVEAPTPVSVGLLRALFDLTPAEARVAQEMLSGAETDRIAANLGITRETARNHLKSILRKTGFQRRIDLTLFMSGTAIFDRS